MELPPSVNDAYFPSRGRLIHTSMARDYIDLGSWIVKEFCMKHSIKPFDFYKEIRLNFYLKRSNSDSHNYTKLLFDCLEKGGLFTNDRLILNHTDKIEIDPKNPRVEVFIEI